MFDKCRVGTNRFSFLLDSLQDLDASFKARGSRLMIVHGNPPDIVPKLIKVWSCPKTLADCVSVSVPLRYYTLPPGKHKLGLCSAGLKCQTLTCTYIPAVRTVDIDAQAWKIGKVCFEADTEPYSVQRDRKMVQNIEAAGVPWHSSVSHTLYVRSAGNTSFLCSYTATLP